MWYSTFYAVVIVLFLQRNVTELLYVRFCEKRKKNWLADISDICARHCRFSVYFYVHIPIFIYLFYCCCCCYCCMTIPTTPTSAKWKLLTLHRCLIFHDNLFVFNLILLFSKMFYGQFIMLFECTLELYK